MHRRLIWVAVLAMICLAVSGVANADSQNLQLGCSSITCVTGGSIITTGSLAAGDKLTITGDHTTNGEFWIAVYTPVGTSGGNFNSTTPGGNSAVIWQSGVLTSAGDDDSGGNDHNYGSSVNMEGLAGTGATAFNVTDIDIGLISCPTGPPCTFNFALPAGPSYVPGTIIVGFTEDPTGNIVADTPWSESLISGVTSAPEPTTLGLLGLGLLGLPFVRRRQS
jgi:hypothetical protein